MRIMQREQRLKELYEKNGKRLRPEDVIKDAKRKTSPLHAYFEWDDSKAAHQYRLNQARQLIREVRIKIEYTEHAVSAPVYVQDTRANPQDGGGYIAAADVMDDHLHAQEVLTRRLGVIHTELISNMHLAAQLGLDGDFQAFLDSIDDMRSSIETAA